MTLFLVGLQSRETRNNPAQQGMAFPEQFHSVEIEWCNISSQECPWEYLIKDKVLLVYYQIWK